MLHCKSSLDLVISRLFLSRDANLMNNTHFFSNFVFYSHYCNTDKVASFHKRKSFWRQRIEHQQVGQLTLNAKESGSGRCLHFSISATLLTASRFQSYLKRLNKGYRSLSEFHTHGVQSPPPLRLNHPSFDQYNTVCHF